MTSVLKPSTGVYGVKRGHFLGKTEKFASGSKYGPLTTDHFAYLCPDCGGWGEIGSRLVDASQRNICEFCKGAGEIPLDDPRVQDTPSQEYLEAHPNG